MPPWLCRFLSQDNGTPSSMRLFVFMWHVPCVLLFTGLTIYHRHFEDIPPVLAELLCGLTGIKAIQKFGEPPPPCDGR